MEPGDDPSGDAFAETVAPASDAPTRPSATGTRQDPPRLGAGSLPAAGEASRPAGSQSDELWRGETLDATPTDRRGAGGDALPTIEPALYVAEREVARGGMGRIIAATDTRLDRPVAIKELLATGGDPAERFRREALITARLQHPAIVPVYEAGRWPSGEPFYAMKLVAGRPLDKVLADGATLEDRLGWLPSVIAAADAIAYAHSRKVIHRDLKPSNVLVGDFGETVVIDWGLAKEMGAPDVAAGHDTVRDPEAARAAAATDDQPRDAAAVHADDVPAEAATAADASASEGLTVVGAVMGTPAYMPPEQARGEAVDERADVFALGAMLYHLLTGRAPYQARTASEVVEAAMKGVVVPVRRAVPRAAPDLCAIVERAMAPAPDDRYPDAGALADELRRFQTGQLVGAHRYSARERLGRFVRRHRAAVTIAAIALVAFAGLGTFAIHRVVAERDAAMAARAAADTRRVAAEKLVDFALSDLRHRLEPIGRLDLLAGLGAGVESYYDALGGGALGPDDVDRKTQALDLIAQAQQSRGDLDAAITTWAREAAALDALLAAHPDAPGTAARRRRRADLDLSRGSALASRGRTADAIRDYQAGIRAYDELLRQAPDDDDLALGAGAAHDRLGDLHRAHGNLDQALAQYRTALDARGRAARHRKGDRATVYALSESHYKLGTTYEGAGQSRQCLAEFHTAARMRQTLVEDDPENTTWQAGLAAVEIELAGFQRQIGQLDEAVTTYRATLPTIDGLVRRDPSNAQWRRDRGNLLSDLGFALLDEGDAKGAMARLGEAIANHTELAQVDPDNASWQVDLSRMYTRTGDAQLAAGDLPAALTSYQQARDLREALLARDPNNAIWRRTVAWSHHKIAGALAVRRGHGDLDAAIAAEQHALDLRTALAAASPDHAGLQDELAQSQVVLGGLLARRGEVGDGMALLDAGIASAQKLVEGDPLNGLWKETLVRGLVARGDTYRRRGDHAHARADLERAVAAATTAAQQAPANAGWQAELARAHWGLATCLHAAGDARAADEARLASALIDRLAKAGRLGAEYRRLAAEIARGP